MMLQPFLGYVLGAAILAFMLMPLQDLLSTYIQSSANIYGTLPTSTNL